MSNKNAFADLLRAVRVTRGGPSARPALEQMEQLLHAESRPTRARSVSPAEIAVSAPSPVSDIREEVEERVSEHSLVMSGRPDSRSMGILSQFAAADVSPDMVQILAEAQRILQPRDSFGMPVEELPDSLPTASRPAAPHNVSDALAAIDAGISSSNTLVEHRTVMDVLGLIQAGLLPEAEEKLKEVLAGDHSTAIIVLLAKVASESMLGEWATKLYVKALRQDPDNPQILRNLVVALNKFDREDIALPLAKQLTEVDPTSEDYAELYALSLEGAGKTDEALAFITDALIRFPDSTILFGVWLDVAHSGHRPTEEIDSVANTYFERVSVSERPLAFASYANALAKADRDDLAIMFFERAFDSGFKSAIARGNYAVELSALDREEDALDQFELALTEADDVREFGTVQRQYVRHLLVKRQIAEAKEVQNRKYQGDQT